MSDHIKEEYESFAKETVKAASRTMKWLIFLFVALLVFLAVEMAFLFRTTTDIPELLTTPIQTVNNRLEGVDGPALTWEEPGLSVSAEKCLDDDRNAVVKTTVQWASIEPRGTVITDWVGTAEFVPGCQDIAYLNPIPRIAQQRTRDLLETLPDLRCITWEVTGVDAPLDPSRFQPVRWETEPFCLYPPKG